MGKRLRGEGGRRRRQHCNIIRNTIHREWVAWLAGWLNADICLFVWHHEKSYLFEKSPFILFIILLLCRKLELIFHFLLLPHEKREKKVQICKLAPRQHPHVLSASPSPANTQQSEQKQWRKLKQYTRRELWNYV